MWEIGTASLMVNLTTPGSLSDSNHSKATEKRSLFHGTCARNWYGGFQASNMCWEIRIIAIQHQHSVRFWKPTKLDLKADPKIPWKNHPKTIQNPMDFSALFRPLSPLPLRVTPWIGFYSPGHRFSIISKGTLMPPPPMPGAPAKNRGEKSDRVLSVGSVCVPSGELT